MYLTLRLHINKQTYYQDIYQNTVFVNVVNTSTNVFRTVRKYDFSQKKYGQNKSQQSETHSNCHMISLKLCKVLSNYSL